MDSKPLLATGRERERDRDGKGEWNSYNKLGNNGL